MNFSATAEAKKTLIALRERVQAGQHSDADLQAFLALHERLEGQVKHRRQVEEEIAELRRLVGNLVQNRRMAEVVDRRAMASLGVS